MMTNKMSERGSSFIKNDLDDLLIDQYIHEQQNAEIYRFFASWAHVKGYPGTQKWFLHQHDEERSHAQKIYDFLTKGGVSFSVPAITINCPKIESCSDVFLAALNLETKTTDMLNKIVDKAGEDKDYITQEFATQVLFEQIPEEEEARIRYNIICNTNDMLLADHVIGDL